MRNVGRTLTRGSRSVRLGKVAGIASLWNLPHLGTFSHSSGARSCDYERKRATALNRARTLDRRLEESRFVYKWWKFNHTIASHFHEARVQFVQYTTGVSSLPDSLAERTP